MELEKVLGSDCLDKISRAYFGRPSGGVRADGLSEDRKKVSSHIEYDIYNKGILFIEDVAKVMELKAPEEVK
ncbi:hypothetical protein D3C78_1906900 [compost metagenome]